MTALAVLDAIDRIEVASPCDASWEEMRGDDRVRFCGLCSKNVYNFAKMSRAEIAALIANTEGRVCGRLFRRADGTVLTSDCPVGLAERSYQHAKRLTLGAACAVAMLLCSLAVFVFGRTSCDAMSERVRQRVEQVRKDIAPPQVIAGGLKAPPEMGEVAPASR